MTKQVFALLASAVLHSSVFAQGAITGSIPQWSLGTGEVVTGLMEPMVVGSVDADGNFSIPLKPGFMEEIRKQVEQQNAGASEGWTSSLLTVGQVFSCYGEGLEVVNADQPMTRMTTMGVFNLVNMDEKKRLGYVMATSSEAFARGIMEMGSFTFTEGYILDWVFVDQAASVRGSCATESYAVNQEEKYTRTTSYDLALRPGWNLIKYEISGLFSDRDGKTYPGEERYLTLSDLPADLKYVFFPE